jgi:ribonuclease III
VTIKIIERIRLALQKKSEPYLLYYNTLGVIPHQPLYYQQAVTHKSASKNGESNERLEFLGDAILNAIVANLLYQHYPNSQEGELTTMRSEMVKRNTLNIVAKSLGIDELVVKSKNINLDNSSLLGNTLEALIGAIYIDLGYKTCENFVRKNIFEVCIANDSLHLLESNYKSQLIEWCQKNKVKIEFILVHQDKSNTDDIFVSEVFLNNKAIARASGMTKKKSEQAASQLVLQRIKSTSDFKSNLYLNEFDLKLDQK